MAFTDRIPYQAQIDRPKLKLPGGKKLAVWVILNVEEWRIENAMPRTVLSPPMGQPLLPDVPNWSWHEYGMRAGFWRQFKALTDRNMPVTLALNANVCNSYPRVASAALEAGFEFMGHGFVQGPMHKLDNQAEAIKRAVDTIAKFANKAPRSWESPGLTETEETIDLLRLNGIEYLADWVIDDLPQDIATPHGVITTVPYSVETNDIVIHALQHLSVRAVFETLHRPVRPALSRGRRQCADHGDLDPPLHHRRSASHQISGGAARLCHRP